MNLNIFCLKMSSIPVSIRISSFLKKMLMLTVTEAPHILLNEFDSCRLFTANILELTLWSCEAGGQYFSIVISSVMLKILSLTAVLHVTSTCSISDECSFVLFAFSSKSGITVCA